MRYKEFLLQVAKDWAADKMEAVEPESDTDSMRPGSSTQPPRRPYREPPGRLLGDMRKHVLEKIMKSEENKRKYPSGRCHVCATHKKGVKLGTCVCSPSCHSKKLNVSRDITPSRINR
jgi:hypothetical protein